MAKSKLAKRRSRRRRKNQSESVAASSGDLTQTAYQIGAGFAGYTATRLLSRLAFSQAVKKFGDKGAVTKHAAFLASAAGAAGVYFGSKKWDKIDEYHEEFTIGAGIALAQSFVQTYLPQYGWIVGDMSAAQYAPKEKAKAQSNLVSNAVPSLPGIPDEIPETSPQASSDFDLDAFMAEHGVEEGEQVAQLPPVGGHDSLDLDSFGLGSLGDSGDGLGDYSDAHELH